MFFDADVRTAKHRLYAGRKDEVINVVGGIFLIVIDFGFWFWIALTA